MSAAKLELTGGGFQDSEGNVLALGYLVFKLSQDSEVNGSQICSGVEITINLDVVGNAATGQYIWGNDALSPVNSYYTVTGYTAEGQPAWGPNNQQVVGTGTFNLGSWIPNQVISWVPPVQSGTSIEVEGIALSSSSVADFVNTGNVHFTDAGGGQIEATSTGAGTSIEIEGTPLSSSTVADFVNTGNVTFTDLGSGHISATATTTNTFISRQFWSTDYFPAALQLGLGGPGGTNFEIWSYPLYFATGAIIGHITAKGYNPYAGSTFSVAIYTWDGNTKLLDSGAFDAGNTSSQTLAITPVSIPAGYYRLAWGQESAGVGWDWGIILAYPDMYNANNAHQFVVSNVLYVHGGPMPTSLGTLTDALDIAGLPSFFFQP